MDVSVIDQCFSKDEITEINIRAKKTFSIIEETSFNTKWSDLDFSLFNEIIFPKIISIVGTDFSVKGGYLNSTSSPYKIHSDGARHLNESIKCTVLLPIDITPDNHDYHDNLTNNLFIFNQTSNLATVFRNGNKVTQLSPYYRLARSEEEYCKYLNDCTNLPFDNQRILNECNHLNPDEFWGLSLKTETSWNVGKCIIFHPHNLHVSSNFKNLGIKSKTNLVYSLKK